MEGRVTSLKKAVKKLMSESYKKQCEGMIWGLKMEYNRALKTQASAIRRLET